MACFLIPAAEAVVTTIAGRIIRAKSEKSAPEARRVGQDSPAQVPDITFSGKLPWLTNLLWGGALLLAFEHVWHGEVVPWFPFLTAASDPSDTAAMLHEMSTVGVSMAALVTLVWVGMVLVARGVAKKALRTQKAER